MLQVLKEHRLVTVYCLTGIVLTMWSNCQYFYQFFTIPFVIDKVVHVARRHPCSIHEEPECDRPIASAELPVAASRVLAATVIFLVALPAA
jgi:hypothetical protein